MEVRGQHEGSQFSPSTLWVPRVRSSSLVASDFTHGATSLAPDDFVSGVSDLAGLR